MTDDFTPALYWDTAYAVALALIETFPDRRPEDIGLMELADMVEILPGFCDDPALVTDRFLLDIQSSWYEELTNI